MSATPIEISVGGSRWASSWVQDLMTWEDFTESLSARMYNNASAETHAEYMALSKAEQDKRKDVGGFVGGSLRGGSRKLLRFVQEQIQTQNGLKNLLDSLRA